MTQVWTTKDSIEIQSGAVVSREIVKNTGGTVTIFAFDKNQGLSEHSAPYEALVAVIEGKAKITVGEETFELSEGQMILLPANVTHSVKALEEMKMILTMIKG